MASDPGKENIDPGIINPPWDLQGRGFMLFYRFDPSFIFEQTSLPARYHNTLTSNYGVVMLVDYTHSPVGPYKELLLIPGKFNLGGKERYYISKIFVDSKKSMISGRHNWGIPKELASFEWDQSGSHTLVRLTKSAKTIFSIILTAGMIPVPVNTRLLPIQLYQEYNNQGFFVAPKASGTGRKGKIVEGTSDERFFPDIFSAEPWLVVKVDPFNMHFPNATRV
jgi:hypothetical protein